MRSARSLALAALPLLGLLAARSASRADEKPPVLRGEATTAARKIVLLELYTSQG